jgi:hypothetical protein
MRELFDAGEQRGYPGQRHSQGRGRTLSGRARGPGRTVSAAALEHLRLREADDYYSFVKKLLDPAPRYRTLLYASRHPWIRLEETGVIYANINDAGAIVRSTKTCDGMKYWHVIRNGNRISLKRIRDQARAEGNIPKR